MLRNASSALTITNTATGATAQAVVADACPGCATYHSLDLSTGLFQALGNLDQGIRESRNLIEGGAVRPKANATN